jgi:hypothetical protein
MSGFFFNWAEKGPKIEAAKILSALFDGAAFDFDFANLSGNCTMFLFYCTVFANLFF